MVEFFIHPEDKQVYALETSSSLSAENIDKLSWLFENALPARQDIIKGKHIGPRKEMISPWSTNAVEITLNMGISGIKRIEIFRPANDNSSFDPMLEHIYEELNQTLFTIDRKPEVIRLIDDLEAYNNEEGLALNPDEIQYLKYISKKIGRKLTDTEVFGFSQVNSEHCRHKIFNAKFVINGMEMPESLFGLIKKTAAENPNLIISAYKDNVAFIEGPEIEQFAPEDQGKPSIFRVSDIESIISIKAETHNFPTTVEPFYGASTGSGGEIRDRMAGGKGSMPLAGTAVYMTSATHLDLDRTFFPTSKERKWLYQSPVDILIKASNGASDFGNKFGQPLICGSVLTFEHDENDRLLGYDKVIMLAGGVGYGVKKYAKKDIPIKGHKVVMLGGDNYRIGMGGGAVSSVNTGDFSNTIELNAVQRANPEMQKRIYNVIRALAEDVDNPIVSIHDHGAGGHLNCFSELLENTGGTIYIDKLPKGDPTLSDREIVGNESQERMGLIIPDSAIEKVKAIADRERAPFYIVGEVSVNHKLVFIGDDERKPIDIKVEYLFGDPPRLTVSDSVAQFKYSDPAYDISDFNTYLEAILQLEAVACKDWLTNKVDRSVTGRIAMQQCCGKVQLPLNNLGIVALDYQGIKGVATAIGHAPIAALIDSTIGSRLAVAEALTNLVWAPLRDGLAGVSLSANWMWPSKNAGEDARLYSAVKALSDFSIALGINVPTGKDSLSMTQQYPDGSKVIAPGTVIVTAVAEVTNIKQAVSPVLVNEPGSTLIFVRFDKGNFKLGGSSFYQVLNSIGSEAPEVSDADYFSKAFKAIQRLITRNRIMAGHDISAGGLMTCLLEMCFPNPEIGLDINISGIPETDIPKILFSENPGVVIQTKQAKEVVDYLIDKGLIFYPIGRIQNERTLKIIKNVQYEFFNIDELRNCWFKKSHLLDQHQCAKNLAEVRYKNLGKQPLSFIFPESFKEKLSAYNLPEVKRGNTGVKAAIIREKGVNGDREMAYCLHLAGFDVVDVHMTDLISGRENLKDINFIVFVGGFSNSDVTGSAKGWAGGILHNEKARLAISSFFDRQDTLSLGVCNGCQLLVHLGLMHKDHDVKPSLQLNKSHKFESGFINVDVLDSPAIMLKSMNGSRLGIWVAHGEGQFVLPKSEADYCIPMKYTYNEYPGNPNGSDYNAAAICSADGRHLAMMPHLERAIFPWQWAYYDQQRLDDEVTPWFKAFRNAFEWITNHKD